MKAEYINPFIEATPGVIKSFCNVEVRLGKISVIKSPYHSRQVVVLIGVVGKIRGQVALDLSEDTAKRIASAMMGGMPVPELDEMSKSAVAELGNTIMGSTSTILESRGIDINITPPSVLVGEKVEVTNEMPTIVIPFELQGYGTISMKLSITGKL